MLTPKANNMSQQMWKSYQKARDAALADVRGRNSVIHQAMNEIRFAWNKANAELIQAIEDRRKMDLADVQAQMQQLRDKEQAIHSQYQAAQDALWAQMWKETESDRSQYDQEGEAISKEWKEIEERIDALYLAKLEAKRLSA